MKHNISITAILIIFFFIAQFIGLFVVSEYINIEESNAQGKTVIKGDVYENSIGGTPPEIENQSLSWILVIIMVLVGTGLVLLIVKFKMHKAWKIWFYIAITMCIANALIPFLNKLGINTILSIPLYGEIGIVKLIAIGIGGLLSFLKIFRSNIIIHNLTEIIIYGGLVAFLMPLINLTSAIVLLILISIYDMYAVWKSKHMVSMAEFQTESKMFAGLMLKYKDTKPTNSHKKHAKVKTNKNVASKTVKKKKSSKANKSKHSKSTKITEAPEQVSDGLKTAILGGGDIAFPLIFASAVMGYYGNFMAGIMIIIFSTIALTGLFMYSKKGKYYPAMPFIGTGCFVGLGMLWLLGF